MFDFDHRDRFYLDGTDRKYFIECQPLEEGEEVFTLTDSDLAEESIKITESIMNTDTLTFANCMSTCLTFVTYKKKRFKQRIIKVWEKIDNYEDIIPIGVFYVDQDTISKDGETREIVAYDKMFFVINLDATDFYNLIDFPVTIKDLRDLYCNYMEIEQDDSILINDDILLPKQLSEDDTIYGSDIIKAIAELNGVFPHINKDGVLQWISIDTEDINAKALFPSGELTFPGSKTYPGVSDYHGFIFEVEKRYYVEDSVDWANYQTLFPDGVEIRNEKNEIVYQTDPYAINPYIVINNMLTYYLSDGQYQTIGDRLYDKIKDLTYIPFEAKVMTDPCLELGDRIMVKTQSDTKLLTYVFTKEMAGMQVPFDNISANGTLLYNEYKEGNDGTSAKLKNLDQRLGNVEKSGTGPLQIVSVATLPANPQLNVLYLIQGEVVVN